MDPYLVIKFCLPSHRIYIIRLSAADGILHYNSTSLYLHVTTLQQHFVVTGHVTGAVAKKECSAAYQKRGCPLCLTFLEDAISRDIHLQGCKRFRASPLIQVSENKIKNRDSEERGRTRERERERERVRVREGERL